MLSIVLMITVSIAFVAVLYKGPLSQSSDFIPPQILDGAGFALLISLVGWMPSGMEASTMNSIWVVEKIRSNNYHPSLKEGLFDFNLGYLFTMLLAFMFLTIGAFTMYGSGQLLDGNTTQFSKSLISVFTSNLGEWSFWVIAIAAFGTVFGTLITILDAFARSFVRCMWEIRYSSKDASQKQDVLQKKL